MYVSKNINNETVQRDRETNNVFLLGLLTTQVITMISLLLYISIYICIYL